MKKMELRLSCEETEEVMFVGLMLAKGLELME